MDFVIPLPKNWQGYKALLLFQDHFTGFVIAKAMNDTSALNVAKAFGKYIFRHFGAFSLIRHDRDDMFKSEIFQTFAEMMQDKSRATLNYRLPSNKNQERSAQKMIQRVHVNVNNSL